MTILEAPVEQTGDPDLSALLARAAGGDCDAFTRFYDLTAPRIYALLLTLTPDASTAERVLETIYVEAWERMGGREAPPCPGMEWMSFLAHRHAARR